MIKRCWNLRNSDGTLCQLSATKADIGGLMDTLWKELHSNYQEQNWIEKPSIFAETAIQYFPKSRKILELGAGHGQDS